MFPLPSDSQKDGMNQHVQDNSRPGLRLRPGFITDMCLSVVGTTWVELERATRAEDAGEFKALGERLLRRIVVTAAGCTIVSTIAILATPGDPSNALVVARFFTVLGVASTIRCYARLEGLLSSPSALCELSQSSRFTRFFLQQALTYLSSYIACSLTLINFYLALCHIARSWGIVFPTLVGIAAAYVLLDSTS
ncbi:hypothetical protein BD769DRAFT_619424 [Suillus cothurnatus]|nr:hypothetical protein BD769DRAFT_619424 [Suillus cothurnatus]